MGSRNRTELRVLGSQASGFRASVFCASRP